MKIPTAIKIILFLMAFQLIGMLNAVHVPFFIFLGIIFLDSLGATIFLSILMLVLIVVIFSLLRRVKGIYYFALGFFGFLMTNSLINMASFFIINDEFIVFLRESMEKIGLNASDSALGNIYLISLTIDIIINFIIIRYLVKYRQML